MSSQLHVIISNRLETLADAMSAAIAESPSTPDSHSMQPEMVLVQSKGMERWISMAVAQRNGICANLNFPFPNAFIETLYQRNLPPPAQETFMDGHTLAFRIASVLPQMLEEDDFEAIRNYLRSDRSQRMLHQLATKIADVFDQYQIFRPDLLHSWESDRSSQSMTLNAWQPLLWYRLNQNSPFKHRASMQQRLVEVLLDQAVPLDRLPARVSVFGISHLPPFHFEVLTALSSRIPVYLFLLNPCRHYWGDIVSDRQRIRAKNKSPHSALDPIQDLHLVSGNRLLASWGEQGKQFLNLVHQTDAQMVDQFVDNGDLTLLGQIQRDILDLIDHHDRTNPYAILQNDTSLQIHVCHSPMREVEVLHDQLVDLFEQDPELAPRDILVMTPDIETYGPFIHSVFGADPLEGRTLPYTVADQSIAQESRLIEGFLGLLGMYGSRFNTTQVLALLTYEPIRSRFGITESQLSIIEKWLQQAQVRWGWNKEHRQTFQLPPIEQNTWQHGLDRLLLGYAMASTGQQVFDDKMPAGNAEDAGNAALLGNLISMLEKLYHQVVSLPAQAQVVQWSTILLDLLDSFFRIDESNAREMKVLRDAMDLLAYSASTARFKEAVSFEVVLDHLHNVMYRKSFGSGFMAGGVTFCAMLPMRSIPSKVICLLGMGHGDFPQEMHEPAFNLIAAHPRAGDRSKREDDKYLFLEALISARKVLYMSYVGRSVQDNSVIPPAVVIDELLEYAEEALGVQREHLVTEHPLQAYSKRYFDDSDPRIFSYAKENLDAAKASGRIHTATPFFSGPLDAPDRDWRHCSFDQLRAFYTHPTRFLMEKRLDIVLRKENVIVKDRENFNLDALDQYHLKQQLLDLHLQGRPWRECYALLQASGTMPHGGIGQTLFHQLRDDVLHFVATLEGCLPKETGRHHTLDLSLGPYRLSGVLDGIFEDRRIVYRLAKTRPQDLISMFMAHMAMAADLDEKLPTTSFLVCQDGVWQLGAVNEPSTCLTDYLDLYWQGLHAPLPFFPRSSYAYALSKHKGRSRHAARRAALNQWLGSPPYHTGEIEDPYIQRSFGHGKLLPPGFEETAQRVLQPLLTMTAQI